MPAAEHLRPEQARRARRYRRRLRSRIILSFVLLGFGLTALFAWSVGEVRDEVEDKLVVDVMNRNIDLYAQQYERDPQNPSLPVDQMRAFAFTPDKFESVRQSQPDWYELSDGIHGLSGVDEAGRPFSYKLAVRKTP
ncbi:MAG TPA: two-component sensor histidine kinase, partial [Xanthomonadaceae bacterium]|nr:two-component sensor histidine kinase [Xanthomonadaceae bacterium]